MKILWLVHPEPDYGEAMLYDGLCRTLGDENVVDFPYKYTYHGETERGQNKNVRRCLEMEINSENCLQTLKQKWVPFEWMVSRKGIDYDYADILNMCTAKYFDLIVLAHPRVIAIWFLEQLFKDLGNVHQKAPVVMCDFEDYNNIRHDILGKFNIKLSFKLAYVRNEPNIYGLPFCSIFANNPKYNFDDSHKTIDVAARWGITHPLRQKVMNELLQIQNIVGTMKMNKHLPTMEYMKEIAMSKIGVSMGGFTNVNRTAVKHWEIPSYRTMLLCEDPNIIYAHPFENGKHCVFFDPNTDGDVKRKIEHYLSHDKERQTIADAGHEHLKKYHTTAARAKYFLDVCMKYYPQLKEA